MQSLDEEAAENFRDRLEVTEEGKDLKDRLYSIVNLDTAFDFEIIINYYYVLLMY